MNYSEQELTKKQNMLLDTRIKWKNRLRVSSRIAVIVLLIAFLLRIMCRVPGTKV